MLAEVLEGNAELLEASNIFQSQGHYLLLHDTLSGGAQHELGLDCLLADELGDLDLTRQQNLQPLDLRSLPTILKEVFHATIKS